MHVRYLDLFFHISSDIAGIVSLSHVLVAPDKQTEHYISSSISTLCAHRTANQLSNRFRRLSETPDRKLLRSYEGL